MLHKRLATDIRDHFSTVGPSPRSSIQTTSPQLGPLAATLNPTSPDPTYPDPTAGIGPRLVLPTTEANLPPVPPGSQRRNPFLPDLLATAAHRSAASFAEAAVLVLVLGILDRLLARGHLELPWIAGIFLATVALLAASILTDVSARRWLRAH